MGYPQLRLTGTILIDGFASLKRQCALFTFNNKGQSPVFKVGVAASGLIAKSPLRWASSMLDMVSM